MAVKLTEEQIRIEREKAGHDTLEDAYKMLQKHKRVVVVRPTGFGKSHMLAYLSKRYEKSLYVYPLDIIKIDMQRKYKDVLHNVEFMSYRALLEKFKEKDKRGNSMLKAYLKEQKFGLIMFDEVHTVGSKGFRETYKDFEYARERLGTHLIGVTATPDREDEFNYEEKLFGKWRVRDFTLHDCITKGIMLPPYYVRSSFNAEVDKEKYKKAVREVRKTLGEDKLKTILKQREIEIANLLNADEVIRKHVCKVHGEPDYLKFIVFFSNIHNMHETKNDVANWFKEAFPKMTVEHLIVSSEDVYRDNLEKLGGLEPRSGVIDLIFCIDMLNMGYHVDSVSGVVLIRSTQSERVYKQQIGRCLSVKAKKNPIIFDFVDNYKYGAFKEEKRAKKNLAYASDRNRENSGLYSDVLDVRDLIIDDMVEGYAEIMERLSSASVDYTDRLVKYLYTDRKMPLYIIEDRTGIKREDIKRILAKYNIQLEDESNLKSVTNNQKRLHIPKKYEKKTPKPLADGYEML